MGRNIQGSAGISGDSRILYIKNRIFLCNRDCDCIELSEVCDNPLQDIPLMGVLRSTDCRMHFTGTAELRIQYPDGLLYESVSAYAGENEILEKELDPDKVKY